MFEISNFLIIFLAFVFEVVDASLGMGYGTALIPILLIIGFDAIQIVPAVLVSQLAGDFLASFFHHKFKNANLSIKNSNFKIAMSLSILSSFGSILAVLIAINLPKLFLNMYIGILVTVIGIFVLGTMNKIFKFSWLRLFLLSSLASFNKGISGGGYGPLVTGGQVLTGVDIKSAIGITSLSEGITCIVALLMYFIMGKYIDWTFSVLLVIGVAFSTPVSAFIIRKIDSKKLKIVIGVSTILLGILTLLNMAKI